MVLKCQILEKEIITRKKSTNFLFTHAKLTCELHFCGSSTVWYYF